MGWVADVITRTTIQSVWGNAIRDRVVHQFANKSERDATAVPREGMQCQTADTGIVYVYRGGAWWVLAMPWRSFTPRAWAGTPAWVEVGGIVTQYARWRQTMGRCTVQAAYQASFAGVAGFNATIGMFTPVAATNPGPMGQARTVVNATATASGGWAAWLDNAMLGGGVVGSRVIMGNVGVGVAVNTVANVPAGNTNIFLDMNLAYECDPTIDTP